MGNLEARATAAAAVVDAELARSSDGGRRALLRALSRVNARWVDRLAAHQAGTRAYDGERAQTQALEQAYLAELQQALRGRT